MGWLKRCPSTWKFHHKLSRWFSTSGNYYWSGFNFKWSTLLHRKIVVDLLNHDC